MMVTILCRLRCWKSGIRQDKRDKIRQKPMIWKSIKSKSNHSLTFFFFKSSPVYYFLKGCFFFFSFYSSVTAQSFIWQTKDSTPSRHEGRPTPKERPQSVLASSFYMFCVLHRPVLSLLYANWASQEGCLFHLRFSLWSVNFLLFHFFRLFPFFIF